MYNHRLFSGALNSVFFPHVPADMYFSQTSSSASIHSAHVSSYWWNKGVMCSLHLTRLGLGF